MYISPTVTSLRIESTELSHPNILIEHTEKYTVLPHRNIKESWKCNHKNYTHLRVIACFVDQFKTSRQVAIHDASLYLLSITLFGSLPLFCFSLLLSDRFFKYTLKTSQNQPTKSKTVFENTVISSSTFNRNSLRPFSYLL